MNVVVVVMDSRKPVDAPLLHMLRAAHMLATRLYEMGGDLVDKSSNASAPALAAGAAAYMPTAIQLGTPKENAIGGCGEMILTNDTPHAGMGMVMQSLCGTWSRKVMRRRRATASAPCKMC